MYLDLYDGQVEGEIFFCVCAKSGVLQKRVHNRNYWSACPYAPTDATIFRARTAAAKG